MQQYYALADRAGAYEKVKDKANRHFPVLVSLVISQGPCSFKQSRAIRCQLLTKLKTDNYTPQQFLEALPSVTGLSAKKRCLLEKLATNDNDDWKQLPGIGPWTRKAYEIMTGTDPCIALVEDSHVKKRMAAVGVTWNEIPSGWETRMSRLFWRLTEQGASRLGQYLTRAEEPIFVDRDEFY